MNKGDTVQLKSGGPYMTIEDPQYEGGKVRCVWFETTQSTQVRYAVFPPECLKPVDPR
jgi:uncharacterized protein YodC (DUF2158 family)